MEKYIKLFCEDKKYYNKLLKLTYNTIDFNMNEIDHIENIIELSKQLQKEVIF